MIWALIRMTRAPGDETLGLAVVVIFSVGGDWFVAGLADLAIRQRVPAVRWGDIVTDQNRAGTPVLDDDGGVYVIYLDGGIVE